MGNILQIGKMSIYDLIGNFLKDKGFEETLSAFEREYGKPIDTVLHEDEESLFDIIADRNKFRTIKGQGDGEDVDVNGLGTKDDDLLLPRLQIIAGKLPNWTIPYPKNLQILAGVGGLVISSCILQSGTVVVSTADLKIHVIEGKGKMSTHSRPIGGVVVKKVVPLGEGDRVLLCGMNGKVYICKCGEQQFDVIEEFQAHNKLITDIQVYQGRYIVTLGWDFLLKVFNIDKDCKVEPLAECKLSVQGTCFTVTQFEGRDYVVLGKNEHTLLEVYDLNGLELQYKISLNDAIFSTAGFTPRCVISNGGAIVVATSHEPFMRLIIVTLSNEGGSIRRDQIIRNLNTMAPQDKFSHAIIGWRNDYSGIWCAGEDGIVRGIDIKQQRVIVEMPSHKGKIKSFSYGLQSGEEIFITSGVDRELKLWK